MFDLGFWELMLIAMITLLVVGPDRLPGLARTAGLWMGKLRRFVQSVKQDINQELAAEELQRTLNKQANVPELEEITEEANRAVEDVNQLLTPDDQQPNELPDDSEQHPVSKQNEANDRNP